MEIWDATDSRSWGSLHWGGVSIFSHCEGFTVWSRWEPVVREKKRTRLTGSRRMCWRRSSGCCRPGTWGRRCWCAGGGGRWGRPRGSGPGSPSRSAATIFPRCSNCWEGGECRMQWLPGNTWSRRIILENPAYRRQSIPRAMRIVAPIPKKSY